MRKYIGEIGVVNHTHEFEATGEKEAREKIVEIASREYNLPPETVLYLAEIYDGQHKVIIDNYEEE